jgi:hypothetical protein
LALTASRYSLNTCLILIVRRVLVGLRGHKDRPARKAKPDHKGHKDRKANRGRKAILALMVLTEQTVLRGRLARRVTPEIQARPGLMALMALMALAFLSAARRGRFSRKPAGLTSIRNGVRLPPV